MLALGGNVQQAMGTALCVDRLFSKKAFLTAYGSSNCVVECLFDFTVRGSPDLLASVRIFRCCGHSKTLLGSHSFHAGQYETSHSTSYPSHFGRTARAY
eukprot:scaffold336_cov196-Amphora_coffeaeformis.AAC.24